MADIKLTSSTDNSEIISLADLPERLHALIQQDCAATRSLDNALSAAAQARHADDIERLVAAIMEEVFSICASETKNHEIRLRHIKDRHLDIVPGAVRIGLFYEELLVSLYAPRSKFWATPHPMREIETDSLTLAILNHFVPDWRTALAGVLADRLVVDEVRNEVDIGQPKHIRAKIVQGSTLNIFGEINSHPEITFFPPCRLKIHSVFADTMAQAMTDLPIRSIISHPAFDCDLAANSIELRSDATIIALNEDWQKVELITD